MPEMVERVARGILAGGQERERIRMATYPNVTGFYATPWEELTDDIRENFLAEARDAIEAMREPTGDMSEDIGMEWWEAGDYNGKDCTHCGRQRVMKVDAPDGAEREVCEKCAWDQEAGKYACELEFPTPPPGGKE